MKSSTALIGLVLVCVASMLQAQSATQPENFETQLSQSSEVFRTAKMPGMERPGKLTPIKCDGATDDTDAFNARLAAGIPVVLGPQRNFCKITSSLVATHPGQIFVGSGNQSSIRLVLADGAPAVPLLWVKRSATGARIDNLWIDHNAEKFSQPLRCEKDYSAYFGQAMIVEADYTTITRTHVENGWDNGVGIGYVDDECIEHRAKPVGVQVALLSGQNNGQGIHTAGGIGRQGALFDNLTGSGVSVDGLFDHASYGCFIEDFAGGANGAYRNIQCNGTVWDKSTPRSKADTGIAVYVGGADTTIEGLIAVMPGQFGIWIDSHASAVSIIGCEIKASQSHGILIKGASDITLSGCREKNIGQGSSGAEANAIELDSTLAPINRLLIANNEVSHDGNTLYNAYGVNQTGSHPVNGRINGWFEGTVAPTNVAEGLTIEDMSNSVLKSQASH